MLLHSPQQRLQDISFTFETIKAVFGKQLDKRMFTFFTFTLTFNPWFLLICKVLCPRPDHYIYIVNTENLWTQNPASDFITHSLYNVRIQYVLILGTE